MLRWKPILGSCLEQKTKTFFIEIPIVCIDQEIVKLVDVVLTLVMKLFPLTRHYSLFYDAERFMTNVLFLNPERKSIHRNAREVHTVTLFLHLKTKAARCMSICKRKAKVISFKMHQKVCKHPHWKYGQFEWKIGKWNFLETVIISSLKY